MRVFLWGCRISIFLLVLFFALKNTAPVTVFFFFDKDWQAPMIFVLLAAFACGTVFGLLSLMGSLIGLRRKVSALKREIQNLTLEKQQNPSLPEQVLVSE